MKMENETEGCYSVCELFQLLYQNDNGLRYLRVQTGHG